MIASITPRPIGPYVTFVRDAWTLIRLYPIPCVNIDLQFVYLFLIATDYMKVDCGYIALTHNDHTRNKFKINIKQILLAQWACQCQLKHRRFRRFIDRLSNADRNKNKNRNLNRKIC